MRKAATIIAAVALSAGLGVDARAQGAKVDPAIEVPDGFRAEIFAENLGTWLRHIVVRENGDVYVAVWRRSAPPGVVALRDEDGDGDTDIVERFGDVRGSGLALRGDWLYFGEDDRVLRWRLGDSLVPESEPEVVISEISRSQGGHEAKTLTFDGEGSLYVNVGAPSNACQQRPRTPGSAGRRPCPQLEWHGGIWRFDADELDQTQRADGERYATGLRNSVALEWNDAADALYAVMHGRDQLDTLFPGEFSAQERIELPGEEFHLLREGSNAGWPYTYWDPLREERMIGPEYGGDGETPSDDDRFQDPIQSFPAHWGPNDLIFYDGEMFPERYRGGAFVAHHGSWNRAPAPQAGYNVTFTPFDGETPSADYEVFATGFTGSPEIRSPRQAEHRPTGLAVGPNGALYVADSMGGTIWRIVYVGDE